MERFRKSTPWFVPFVPVLNMCFQTCVASESQTKSALFFCIHFKMSVEKKKEENSREQSEQSVAVFSDAAVNVEVVGLWALALDTGSIHGSSAVQLAVGVTPAAQA